MQNLVLQANFYLGSNITESSPKSTTTNAAIHVECKLLKHVVSSAAEAETGGLFANCQAAVPIRHMLAALNHPQPPTPVRTDNSTASAFVNQTLKAKRSKSWDMRYFWVVDRIKQRQFLVYWDKGSNNWADYFTKHFAPNYHQLIRSQYILKGFNVQYHSPILPARVYLSPDKLSTGKIRKFVRRYMRACAYPNNFAIQD